MKTKPDYSKISPTAIMVARLRAKYTDMPYAGDIYEIVKRRSRPNLFTVSVNLLRRLSGLVSRSIIRIAFFESRYLSVNHLLKRLGDDYVVIEVAAGLSARGLEHFGGNSLYIETDLPEMLNIKRQVIAEILSVKRVEQNPNHVFFPLNALDYAGWERLGREILGGTKPRTAVIHEGLAPYLSREEKDRLRDNIARFFEEYASLGIWITPDFYPYANVRKKGIARFWEWRIERGTGRKYSRFSGPEEVREYLTCAGFQSELVSSASVVDQLTCIAKLNMDKNKVRGALQRFMVSVARYTPGTIDAAGRNHLSLL
jgi:O-methyltransferase involved in polyketide biosynthesis